MANEQGLDPTGLAQVGIHTADPTAEDPTAVDIQQQTKQPFNLYQKLGSMSTAQMLDLRHNISIFKSQEEIKINVGEDRYQELMFDVNAGKTTLKAALDRSKNELTTVMKELDALLYKKNEKGEYIATSDEFSLYRGKHPNMLESEVRRWTSHRNAIVKKEADQAKAELKFRKDISDEQKEIMEQKITNFTYANDAQVDFINLQFSIESAMKPYFQIDELSKTLLTAKAKETGDKEFYIPRTDLDEDEQAKLKLLGEHFSYVMSETAKDMNPETYNQGDQNGIMRSLSAITELVPIKYLRKKTGWITPEGKMISSIAKGVDDATLKKFFFNEMSGHLTRGKNHLNKISPILESRPPDVEAEQQQQQQQQDYPAITTAEEYDSLPSGQIFIDPEGNKRTKP